MGSQIWSISSGFIGMEIGSDIGSDIEVVFWVVIGIDIANDMEDGTGSDIVTIIGEL